MSDLAYEIEMDCTVCGRYCTSAVCPSCQGAAPAPITPVAEITADDDFGPVAAPTTLVQDLTEIATQGAANAAVTGIGSMAGGQLRGVGFSTAEGYITAIRNGVPAHTHSMYLGILRGPYHMSEADLAALNLPGPMALPVLPISPGIVHVPTGPSIFDQPRAQRAFVVGPSAAEQEAPARISITSTELIAGALAEGHHAIVAWEGTSGMTRGALVEALTAIGRADWAPKAPNARAQAGSAINALASGGLLVRALRKGSSENDLVVGEHVWTCGRVNHTGSVGSNYGEVTVKFKLSGSTLTFEGPPNVGASVVAAFEARMAAEQYKSSDVTSWLSRTMRWQLDGVRFGALGWIVPARHVAAAKQLTEAVAAAGFGTGWVHGLPVATSDQLRDGIVRGLVDEVMAVVNQIAEERANAQAAYEDRVATHKATTQDLQTGRGDIGPTRAASHLKDLRAIGGRVVAYGQVLGEARVDRAQRHIRGAIASLETVLGADYTGISARFEAVWEEIEHDRKLAGGVL
jgi:hypothetical protein